MGDHENTLSELERRRDLARAMGPEEKIKRQRALGKLTARERIDLLLDPGSFQEYGLLATHQGQKPSEPITPADGLVAGVGRIDGRPVCLFAEDATVAGGSVGHVTFWKRKRMQELVERERIPFIGLFDGAGARATDMKSDPEGSPIISQHLIWARLSGKAPLIGVAMGACAGLSALEAAQMDLLLMVGPNGMLAAGGPPVVKTSIGLDITKADLGGAKVHADTTGMVDNVLDTDAEALKLVRQTLSYLPINAWQYPPRKKPVRAPTGDILALLPESLKTSYDMRQMVSAIVDGDSFLEFKPTFGDALLTGFARMDGHPVGIIANQPLVRSGAIDGPEAQKARKFIDVCGAYHVPIISLADTPGVMTGPDAEKRASLKHGLAAAYALAHANVPLFTVVLRKSFGFGGALMAGYLAEQTVAFAWPTADFASLPPDAAIEASHQAELDEADDREQKMQELVEAYKAMNGPYPAAGQFKLDDIIDPRETRDRLIMAMETTMARRTQVPVPNTRVGIMP